MYLSRQIVPMAPVRVTTPAGLPSTSISGLQLALWAVGTPAHPPTLCLGSTDGGNNTRCWPTLARASLAICDRSDPDTSYNSSCLRLQLRHRRRFSQRQHRVHTNTPGLQRTVRRLYLSTSGGTSWSETAALNNHRRRDTPARSPKRHFHDIQRRHQLDRSFRHGQWIWGGTETGMSTDRGRGDLRSYTLFFCARRGTLTDKNKQCSAPTAARTRYRRASI